MNRLPFGMTEQFFRLLLELDNREYYTEDYFSWSEELKQSLTEDILLFLAPIMRADRITIEYLTFSLLNAIYRAEELEDYEQADILNRVHTAVLKKIGVEDIY